MDAKRLNENIVVNGYCIGCGNCAAVDNSDFEIKMNKFGCYHAALKDYKIFSGRDYVNICPFTSLINENDIADELFKKTVGIKKNSYEGYVLNRYAGYASEQFRIKGSSGGLLTWLCSKMLEEGLVDSIVHIKKSSNKKEGLYSYAISDDVNSLSEGSSSRYYPITLESIIKHIKRQEKTCAIVGVPCFIKAINLLTFQDNKLSKLIKFKIGIVCGHLKSEYFAKAYSMELGIPYNKIKEINFRQKLFDRPASRYGIKILYELKENCIEEIIVPTSELSVSDWGVGYFKYKACDYCDDVLAETADITFGDAWLPQYINDPKGTNIVIIRNSFIDELIHRNIDEIHLETLSAEDVFKSQAGGFRHRREGLQYRLYKNKKNDTYSPLKRLQPMDNISKKRKNIYSFREILRNKSFEFFYKAEQENNFLLFKEGMEPYLIEYRRINKVSFLRRVMNKLLKKFRKILSLK